MVRSAGVFVCDITLYVPQLSLVGDGDIQRGFSVSWVLPSVAEVFILSIDIDLISVHSSQFFAIWEVLPLASHVPWQSASANMNVLKDEGR